MNLRQLEVFVCIYEEGSFNKAAQRMNATQSGLSMQMRNLEEALGSRLFERSARGVTPTFAGQRLYARAVDILRQLDGVQNELRSLAGDVSGPLRIGLMPTFTRGVLAPTLAAYMREHPNVEVSVVEAYSAVLAQKVAEGEVDFAVVPRAEQREGVASRHLGTDREILVCRAGGPFAHLAPVSLKRLHGLRFVLPARGNARRDAIDGHFALHGVKVGAILDMDAMIATLEFVANSDWVTILPATICSGDLDGKIRSLHPLVEPPLSVSYAVIQPARKALSAAADAFLNRLEQEYARSDAGWQERLGS